MAGRRRVERLNEQFRRELMDILQNQVRDPRVGLVTVTHVEVSPDLYHARVYVTAIDPTARESTLEGLDVAEPFIRGEIGRRLHIRRAPELHFTWDDTLAHAQRIEKLLGEAMRELGPSEADDETA
ncbi:MAG TPA: 30S ribosome-binding factor RbfA [Longimicrobiales bacterium]|nr:30S ribosome-binding factor RbfA [Longimicrobiales bacterium]